jgi:hypothetical protein
MVGCKNLPSKCFTTVSRSEENQGVLIAHMGEKSLVSAVMT